MTTPTTVKTRLCIISDTHFQAPLPATATQYPYRAPLPSADVLLHAGDITMTGSVTEYEGMLNVLKQADAELKIVIAGNHDTTLDQTYYNSVGWRKHWRGREDLAKVREMWTGEEAREAGIVYLDEGTSTFTLKNGAKFTIYTSPYTPEFCNWAFPYKRDQDRYNPAPEDAQFKAPNPIPSWPQVDIVLTHGPPYKILDRTVYGKDVGCENLLKALERVRPRLHCFGHIHEGWGAERVTWSGDQWKKKAATVDRQKMLVERAAFLDLSGDGGSALEFGKETVFVNAAIMNVDYVAANAPWLVDLDLPLAGGLESGTG